MAIIKTYPLKTNYYGPDRLVISDMQPDSEGNVSGDTKNLTLANLKSFIGGSGSSFTLTTTGNSGPATLDTNTNILNIPDYSIANPVDGSGTAGRIPKWSDSNTLDNSEIFQSGTNIGIGTTTPSEKLQINSGYIKVVDNDYDQYFLSKERTDGSHVVGFKSQTAGRLSIHADKVGIGTTAPGEKLEVTGKIKATGTADVLQLYRNSSSQANYIKFYDNATSSNEFYLGFTSNNKDFQISNLASGGTIALRSGGGNTMMLDTDQRVGIGTTSPSAKLDVAGSMNVAGIATLKGDGTNDGKLRFNCSANSHYVEIVGPTHSSGSSYSLKLPNSLPNVSAQILQSNASGILSWVPTPSGGGGGGGGTVTSVGLTMPPAFLVSNSPLSGTGGTISVGVTGGSAGEFLSFNGQWATPTNTTYSVMGSGNSYAAGLVLAGSSNHAGNFLRKDGTWGVPAFPNPSAPSATNLVALSINGNVYGIPQGTGNGTITAVSGQSGISGTGTSGPVVLTNSDRGSSQLFYRTFTPDNGTDVVASTNQDTMLIKGGAGITTSGSGDQISIANNQATNIERGGVKLFTSTLQSVNATGVSSTAGRTYGIQLNSSGQAVVNVPWTSGGGGGISFSGSTADGLVTYSNSTTAAVSSDVTLNNNYMTFDSNKKATGIDYYSTQAAKILRFGNFIGGEDAATVELWANGARRFEIGVNGEIGLGTGASQGTSGQVLTSQGNGSPAVWSSNSGQNIANTNLTQTANRTYAMGQYALTFTGTSSIQMLQSNGLGVTNNINSNGQIWSVRNSIANKNSSFVVDWNDGNVQEVDLTNPGQTNVIISFTNIKPGARYSLITSRLGYETTYGTYSFQGVKWPGNVVPANVQTGSSSWNLYEFVAAGPGLMGYAFRNYQTAS